MKDRIVAINPRLPRFDSWSIASKAPTSSQINPVSIGLVLSDGYGKNSAKTFRGPVADQPQAKQFRSIWGRKTEERRFQGKMFCLLHILKPV